MTTETWKALAEFPSYEVSDQGRVRRNGRVKQPRIDRKGYYQVTLWANSKLRQLTQVVTGTPTRSSYRPQLALGAVVVAKLTTWRPFMAQLTLGTSAAITPTLAAVNGTPKALSTDVATKGEAALNEQLAAMRKAQAARELPLTATQNARPCAGR